jgi:hypothetical protein
MKSLTYFTPLLVFWLGFALSLVFNYRIEASFVIAYGATVFFITMVISDCIDRWLK